jgi:hypothetical protein
VTPEQLAAYRAQLGSATFDPLLRAFGEYPYQHGWNEAIELALRILDRIVPEAK